MIRVGKKKRGLQSFFSYAPLNVTSSCPTLTAKPHYHHSLSSVEKQKNRKEKKSLRIIPPKKRTHLRRCLLAEWRVCVRRGGSVCVCVWMCESMLQDSGTPSLPSPLSASVWEPSRCLPPLEEPLGPKANEPPDPPTVVMLLVPVSVGLGGADSSLSRKVQGQ